MSIEEKFQIYMHIFKSMKKDHKYIEKMITLSRNREKICDKFLDKIKDKINSFSDKELFNNYLIFTEKIRSYVEFPAAVEALDILSEYHIKDMLKKELMALSDYEFENAFTVLTSVPFISFLEDAKRDLLILTLKHKELIKSDNITDEVLSDFKKHRDKHFFIETSFNSRKCLSPHNFISMTKKELKKPEKEPISALNSINNKVSKIKKEKKQALSKYPLNDDMLLHLKIIEELGSFVDERKKIMLKYIYYIHEVCEQFSKKIGIEIDDLMRFTTEEIKGMLLENSPIDLEEAKSRKKFSLLLYSLDKNNNATIELVENKLAKEIFDIIISDIQDRENVTIKGRVVYNDPKTLTGKVQIIMNSHIEKFEKGNILVTSMTRPEFIHIMQDASAIITDEGGITGHAAILSREMKKPCIVSTKNATRVLKTGDKINMNLETGEIKIMKIITKN